MGEPSYQLVQDFATIQCMGEKWTSILSHTWQWEITCKYRGFNGTITYKRVLFSCHFWFPQGEINQKGQIGIATTDWICTRSSNTNLIEPLWFLMMIEAWTVPSVAKQNLRPIGRWPFLVLRKSHSASFCDPDVNLFYCPYEESSFFLQQCWCCWYGLHNESIIYPWTFEFGSKSSYAQKNWMVNTKKWPSMIPWVWIFLPSYHEESPSQFHSIHTAERSDNLLSPVFQETIQLDTCTGLNQWHRKRGSG